MGTNKLRVAILNAVLLIGGTIAYPEMAHAQDQAQTYRIDAGDLESVLSRFGTQSRIQLIYPPDLLKDKRSNGLTGSHTPTEALRRLLEGSGLEAERVNDSTVSIRQAPEPAAQPRATSRNAMPTPPTEQSEIQELERLTVTGTRIRGGVSASPTIVLDEQKFQEEGFSDLGEVIRSIPQNYRGGQNPGVTRGANQGAENVNITGGSALNLRGLGPDATLTLLNGRRMSYDGYSQAVDISAIPIDAVERIEIVPDGASAIYGSDAVGGVANVVLKREFDGVTLGAAYGDSKQGGMRRNDYSLTTGRSWNTGGIIATYKNTDETPILADQRDYTRGMWGPLTLYGGSALRSGLLSAHQAFGKSVEVRLDAIHTTREYTRFVGYNGFYLSDSTEGRISLVAPSVQIALPGDWMLTAGASRGRNESVYDYVIVRDGISVPNSNGEYFNETVTWEVGVEGLLFRVGGRDLRLAAGIGRRTDDFGQRNYVSQATLGQREKSQFAYSELLLPVIGAENARAGLRRLEFSAAARSEDYDGFGQVTTPKLGLVYGPSANLTLKATRGRSFKAPTLRQRSGERYTVLYPAQQLGCISCAAGETVLLAAGGDPGLGPERAGTWTASLAIHPQAVPALDVELALFSIDYSDRVLSPINVLAQTMTDPAYAEFVEQGPSPDRLAQVFADFSDRFTNVSGAEYDPSNVTAIAYANLTNVARQRAKGLDLSGSYRFDFYTGQLVIRGGMSWLDLSQKNSQASAEIDLSGKIFFPAKRNGRIGAVWSRGGLIASAFTNYSSGAISTLTSVEEKTGSYVTYDTTLSYETSSTTPFLSGFTFSLSLSNVFNRSPPLHTPFRGQEYVPYDPTNASAIGRYMTVSLSKHW